MKKDFTKIRIQILPTVGFVLTALLFMFSSAQAVYAQTQPPATPSGASTGVSTALSTVGSATAGLANAAGVLVGATNPALGAVISTAPQVAPAAASKAASAAGDVLAGAVAALAFLMLELAAFLLGIVGALFNWVVVITVFQFGAYFGNTAGLLTAWGILRDIGNILLLFGFIFMGILMILDLHTIDTRKAIPQLIIVAVLINFSLFAAEAVIDVSNVLSSAIYNQSGMSSVTPTQSANQGIVASVMNGVGLSGIFTSTDLKATIGHITSGPVHAMLVYIGLALFVTVTMVVLLAAAIMLIIRGVVLTFVMVLAPLGFAAMVIPPLASQGKKWRDLLISQSFFAPIYLLLVLVSLKIMQAISAGASTTSLLTALDSPSAANSTIFIVFALVIGFMIASLMVAKQMGAIGADFATNVARKTVSGTMLAPARTLGAPLYRNTVGRGAAALQDLQTNPGLVGKLARMANVASGGGLQSTLKKVKESEFLGQQSFQARKDLVKHTEHDDHTAHLKQQVRDGLKLGGEAGDSMVEKAIQSMGQEDYEKELENAKGAARAKLSKLASADRAQKTMDSKDFHGKSEFMRDRYGGQDSEGKDGIMEAARKFKADQSKENFKALKDAAANLADVETDMLAKDLPEVFETLAKAVNINGDPGESIWTKDQRDHIVKSKIPSLSQKKTVRSTSRNKLLEKAIAAVDVPTAQKIYAKMDGKSAGEIGEDIIFDTANDGTKTFKNAAAQVFVDGFHNTERMKGIMSKDQWSEEARTAVVRHWDGKRQTNPDEFAKVKKHLNGSAGSYWGTLSDAPRAAQAPQPNNPPPQQPRQRQPFRPGIHADGNR
jgi:hypothetical protein